MEILRSSQQNITKLDFIVNILKNWHHFTRGFYSVKTIQLNFVINVSISPFNYTLSCVIIDIKD